MKKILAPVFALTLLFSACGSSYNWDHSDPNMPAALREQHQTTLNADLETLKSKTDDAPTLFDAAFQYQFLGDYKTAVDYYNKALVVSPYDTTTLNNLADIYEQVGDYDNAAINIKNLYKLKQDDIEVIQDTVRILLEDKNPTNAQEALDNFALHQPTTSDASMVKLLSDLRQQIADYTTTHPQQ